MKNIIICLIESMRYDRLFNYYSPEFRLEEIHSFSKDAATFHKCIAVANSTWMCKTAMLMGNDKCYHHNSKYEWSMKKNQVTAKTEYSTSLFKKLDAAGYCTSAFITPSWDVANLLSFNTVDREGKLDGIIFGGDDENIKKANKKEDNFKNTIDFVKKNKNNKFAALIYNGDDHLSLYTDIHKKDGPYTRLHCYKETSRLFGDLIGSLKELDLYDSTDIYLLSDHGESYYNFSEASGDWHLQHGSTPFHTTTHIPLIVKSDYVPKGEYHNLVSNIDLYSTILNSLSIPYQSELPLNQFSIDLVSKKREYIVSQNCFISQTSFHEANAVAITKGDYVFITNSKGDEYLFNHIIDPLNVSNLLRGFSLTRKSAHAKAWFSDSYMKELESRILPEFRNLIKKLIEEGFVRKDIPLK